MTDWVPEYCDICLQVGHNCNTTYGKHVRDQKNKHKEEPVKKVIQKKQEMEWKAKPGTELVIQSDNMSNNKELAKEGNQTNGIEIQRIQSGDQHEATNGIIETLRIATQTTQGSGQKNTIKINDQRNAIKGGSQTPMN